MRWNEADQSILLSAMALPLGFELGRVELPLSDEGCYTNSAGQNFRNLPPLKVPNVAKERLA
eukprot:SAG11_NODE_35569_length_266_cov_0.598802_1_plen_61_part_10